jgi:L-alanine-DL-glutamate epimerase-like enolase superfamily enzyme
MGLTTSSCTCSQPVPTGPYLEAHGFGLDRYIEHPLRLEQGMALAPAGPGHGVNFDWNALARLVA